MNKYSESSFENLAESNPEILINLLTNDDLSVGLFARGIKACGRIKNDNLAIEFLKNYLMHSEPIVREATVYALKKHLTPEVRIMLDEVSNNDPNLIIKEIAKEAIEHE